MAATGVAGYPTEPFCQEYRGEFCHRWQLSPEVGFDESLQAVIRNGTTPNGVFGIKLHWSELWSLPRQSKQAGTETQIFAAFCRPANTFTFHVVTGVLKPFRIIAR
jgi:trehalose 2-sulfotransferase